MVEDHPLVFRIINAPEDRRSASLHQMRVRNVEHIAQLCPWAGIVQKRNAFCATVYPAVHFLVPDFQLCTGGRIRTLGMDQQSIFERIAVQPCRHIQIVHPVFRRIAYPPCVLLGKFPNIVKFRQSFPPYFLAGVFGNSRLYCALPFSIAITRSAAKVLSFLAE